MLIMVATLRHHLASMSPFTNSNCGMHCTGCSHTRYTMNSILARNVHICSCKNRIMCSSSGYRLRILVLTFVFSFSCCTQGRVVCSRYFVIFTSLVHKERFEGSSRGSRTVLFDFHKKWCSPSSTFSQCYSCVFCRSSHARC
jgi:hypothetical protein